MKSKIAAVIGMVVCFMMIVTLAWALDIPGIPNGTVKDGNLVWLQDANCFGQQRWFQAMISADSLKSGSCGLRDGSTERQWRLPTKDELVKRQKNLSGFSNVQAGRYWSGTEYINLHNAWIVGMSFGYVGNDAKNVDYYVWPVRDIK